jgi:hypothetical protein
VECLGYKDVDRVILRLTLGHSIAVVDVPKAIWCLFGFPIDFHLSAFFIRYKPNIPDLAQYISVHEVQVHFTMRYSADIRIWDRQSVSGDLRRKIKADLVSTHRTPRDRSNLTVCGNLPQARLLVRFHTYLYKICQGSFSRAQGSGNGTGLKGVTFPVAIKTVGTASPACCLRSKNPRVA